MKIYDEESALIFLKYISDAFQAKYKQLEATKDTEYTDPEDPDKYPAANIFWVPREARRAKLQSSAKQPTIGKIVDDAMVAIEKENPTLKDVLPNLPPRSTSSSRKLTGSTCLPKPRRRQEPSSRGIWRCWVMGNETFLKELPFEEAIDFQKGPGILAKDFRDRRQVSDLQRSGHGSVFNTIPRKAIKKSVFCTMMKVSG